MSFCYLFSSSFQVFFGPLLSSIKSPVLCVCVPEDVRLYDQQLGDGTEGKAIGSVTGWKELSTHSQKMEEVEMHRQQWRFD